MEITDLSWNNHLTKRKNNPLLPKSIRGIVIGKSGCGKTCAKHTLGLGLNE